MNKPYRLSSVAYVAVLVALQICSPHRQEYAKPEGENQVAPTPAVRRASAEPHRELYDPNPDHIWNRLYRAFFVRVGLDGREFGYDELDPLLWSETKYLLSGPSNQLAIKLNLRQHRGRTPGGSAGRERVQNVSNSRHRPV